jgi:hypothetical protein
MINHVPENVKRLFPLPQKSLLSPIDLTYIVGTIGTVATNQLKQKEKQNGI